MPEEVEQLGEFVNSPIVDISFLLSKKGYLYKRKKDPKELSVE